MFYVCLLSLSCPSTEANGCMISASMIFHGIYDYYYYSSKDYKLQLMPPLGFETSQHVEKNYSGEVAHLSLSSSK